MPKLVAVGIGWYREEDYEALRALFADGDLLPDTFDEWLAEAERVEQSVRLNGNEPVRAEIDPVEFPRWCHERALNVDAHSRVAFSTEVAANHAGFRLVKPK